MKTKIVISLSCVLSLLVLRMNSQVSVPTNLNPGNNPLFFVGWGPLVTVPVKIEHQGPADINFITGGLV